MGEEAPVDPIIFRACCTFALDLLECDQLKESEEVMSEYCEGLKCMIQITPYLGLSKYIQLLQMTREYHDSGETGKAPSVFTDSGSINEVAKTHMNDKQESTIDI